MKQQSNTLPPPHPSKFKDATGVAVPVEIQPAWRRARLEVRILTDHLNLLSGLIGTAKDFQDELGDRAFKRFDFKRAESLINSLRTEIDIIKPHAVCPSCNGVNATESCWCKGQGYLSKFHWKTCVTEETKRVTGRNK